MRPGFPGARPCVPLSEQGLLLLVAGHRYRLGPCMESPLESFEWPELGLQWQTLDAGSLPHMVYPSRLCSKRLPKQSENSRKMGHKAQADRIKYKWYKGFEKLQSECRKCLAFRQICLPNKKHVLHILESSMVIQQGPPLQKLYKNAI